MEQITIQMAELLGGEAIDKSVIDKLVSDKARELSEKNQKMDEAQLNKLGASIQRILGCKVDLSMQYQPNQFLFEVQSGQMLTMGDIHTIGGKQKCCKTTLARILMAAVLRGEWNKVKCLVPDMEVVYLDTEMKPVDTQNTLRQIIRLAGVDEHAAERLHMYNFRPLTPEDMKLGIRLYLELHRPQLMFLDGVVDICPDFNDVELSQDLVLNFLMKLAGEYNCAIVNMLHTNKTGGYQELRGHLGAFLEQKGVTVIRCVKDDSSNIVTVTMPTIRYAPVEDWHFTFNDDGDPVDAEQQFLQQQAAAAQEAKQRRKAEREQMNQERREIVLDILKGKANTALRKDVQEEFLKRTGKSESLFKSIVKEMLQAEPPMLYQSTNRTGSLLSLHPLEFNLS